MNTLSMTIPDIIGVVGACLILVGYWMLQRGVFKPDLLYYYVMNGAGASLVVISLIFDWNTSAMIIQASFVFISIWAILKILRYRAKGDINPTDNDK